MQALIAAIPIGLVLLAMGLRHWSAAAAGALGLAVAVLLSLTVFELGGPAAIPRGPAAAGTLAEALHASAVILWIILPALSLYELQRRTGAFERVRAALAGLTDDRRLQALLIAWFFGLFMEGAAGFGTPVALAAPLLVGLGYPPVRAVALALMGHAAGVSFGAVGTPVLTQVEITGLSGRDIAAATAVLHAASGMVLLLLLIRLAADGPLRGTDLAWAALAGLCFFVPSVALAAFAGPELPTLGGALIGGLAFAAVLWRRRTPTAPDAPPYRLLLVDLAPYGAILLLVLATRLLPDLRNTLSAVVFQWQLYGVFRGTFLPLFHPGSLLLAGLVAAALATRRGRHLAPAFVAALKRLAPVALALFVMLALARVLVHAGMITTLATEAARTGAVWPLLAPAIGVLGTFVTGSATASNILFTDFQLTTAAALGLPPVLMAAAQSFGAAVGNIIAPHNIIAGAATVGLKGHEGEILARTVLPCALYSAVGGLLLLGVAARF